jgi:GxxExxY protein
LGPGLLASNHEACLHSSLSDAGFGSSAKRGLPVVYRDVHIDCGDRIDLLVEHRIIVALKAVAQLEPIHEAQLRSCLRLSGCHVGRLINFNGKLLRNGIRRPINELKN